MSESNRITTLEHMILRDEGRGKSDTFIYTVPKVNKVKAYCKLGKLEDIMEHFNISSINQLINILEAWEEVKNYVNVFGHTNIYYNGIKEEIEYVQITEEQLTDSKQIDIIKNALVVEDVINM